MPPTEPRLTIMTSATPVRESVVSSGMARLNTRVGQALRPWADRFIAGTGRNYFSRADVADEIQPIIRLVHLPKPVTRYAGRFLPWLRRDDLPWKLALPGLARELRRRRTDWLFCPCGGSADELLFAVRLSRESGARLALYIVDDFAAGAELDEDERNRELARQIVAPSLRQADRIFSVSPGQRERLQRVYGLDSTLLPLPYAATARVAPLGPASREVLFLGSLSHFYHEPLRLLAGCLDSLNREQGAGLTLRFTLPTTAEARAILGDFACLRGEPLPDGPALARAVADSLLCYAPYAFERRYAEMVSCSFPSKLMDYLCHGRFVLVHSPDYGSAARYFRQHGLPALVTAPDAAHLRPVLQAQLAAPVDHHARYQQVLREEHSYDRFAATVLNTLRP